VEETGQPAPTSFYAPDHEHPIQPRKTRVGAVRFRTRDCESGRRTTCSRRTGTSYPPRFPILARRKVWPLTC